MYTVILNLLKFKNLPAVGKYVIVLLVGFVLGYNVYEDTEAKAMIQKYKKEVLIINQEMRDLTKQYELLKLNNEESKQSYEKIIIEAPLANDCKYIPDERLHHLREATRKANITLRSSSTMSAR